MKIIRTICVTQDEFYEYLENDLIESIKKNSNKEICAKDIKKGLKYSINEKGAARVDVMVIDYERGKFYKSRIKSLTDTITLFFRTKATDKGLEVTFEQHIHSYENRSHSKLSKVFHEIIYGSRMSNTIYNIQNKIIRKREDIEEIKIPKSTSNHIIEKWIQHTKSSN